jgi:hypothetical protein
VRHVRMLGLCLAAVFAMTATTLAVASPALAAKCNEECKQQKEKEKEEAKRAKEEAARTAFEEKTHPWEKYFGECPTHGANISGCIRGEAGPESYYTAGKVTVHFVKPVILQGGMESEETGELPNGKIVGFKHMSAALNGVTIVPAAEPTEGLTEGIDAELLPEKEKKRYEEYVANGGSTTVTATTELAGSAKEIIIGDSSTLQEFNESTGFPGFQFPVMIHLTNKFLGQGCYVGSTSEPIVIPFYTGETSPPEPNKPIHGAQEKLHTKGEGASIEDFATEVNNSYASPGVHGCGIYGAADAALDAGLGLPSAAGNNVSVLKGVFLIANSELVEEGFREGGIPFYNLGEK